LVTLDIRFDRAPWSKRETPTNSRSISTIRVSMRRSLPTWSTMGALEARVEEMSQPGGNAPISTRPAGRGWRPPEAALRLERGRASSP